MPVCISLLKYKTNKKPPTNKKQTLPETNAAQLRRTRGHENSWKGRAGSIPAQRLHGLPEGPLQVSLHHLSDLHHYFPIQVVYLLRKLCLIAFGLIERQQTQKSPRKVNADPPPCLDCVVKSIPTWGSACLANEGMAPIICKQ